MPQDSVLGLDPATIFASGQNKMSTKHFCHTYPLKSGRAENTLTGQIYCNKIWKSIKGMSRNRCKV